MAATRPAAAPRRALPCCWLLLLCATAACAARGMHAAIVMKAVERAAVEPTVTDSIFQAHDILPSDFDTRDLPATAFERGHRMGASCADHCLALVAVHTNNMAWLHRLLWRSTTMQFLPSDMDMLFFLTRPDRSRQYAQQDAVWLEWERQLYSDMVVLDTDEVQTATNGRRMFAMFEWVASTQVSKYEWIVKVDLDTLLQPLALKHLLLGMPASKMVGCRPNNPSRDWCGGPVEILRSAAVVQFARASANLSVPIDDTPEDWMVAEFGRALYDEGAMCWLPPDRVHEPRSSRTHWSEVFTPLSVGLHLLKSPKVFQRAFALMTPVVAAWRACELAGFEGPGRCAEWRRAFQGGSSCMGPRPASETQD